MSRLATCDPQFAELDCRNTGQWWTSIESFVIGHEVGLDPFLLTWVWVAAHRVAWLDGVSFLSVDPRAPSRVGTSLLAAEVHLRSNPAAFTAGLVDLVHGVGLEPTRGLTLTRPST